MSSYSPRVHVAWDGNAIDYRNCDSPSSPFHPNFRPILRKILLINGNPQSSRKGKLDFNIATVKPVYLATFAKKTGHGYRLCGKGYGEGLEPLLQVLNKLIAEVAQEDFVFGDYSNLAAGQELNYLEEYVTVLAELADGDAALTVCFVLFVLTYILSTTFGKAVSSVNELQEFGCVQVKEPNHRNDGDKNKLFKKEANIAIIACLIGNSSMRSVVEAHAGTQSGNYRDIIYALVPPSKDNIYQDEPQDNIRDFELFYDMAFPDGKDPRENTVPALCITKQDFYSGLRLFCNKKKKNANRYLGPDEGTNPPPKTRIELARTGQLFLPSDFEILSKIEHNVYTVRLRDHPLGTYVMKVATEHIKYILKYVMAEVVVESSLWHPHIIALWGYLFCFLDGKITVLLILQNGGQDLARTAHCLNTQDELGGMRKLQDVLGYIVQTNSAIAALHTIGVLHRDIKPSNIVHNKDDPTQVLVIDFNCARLTALANGTQTVKIGSFGFVCGDNEGAAQDVYAMGQTAIFLSSGKTLDLLPRQERIKKQLRAAFSAEVSDQMIDLFSKYLMFIMNPNVSKRWTSLQALVGSSALQVVVNRGGKGADSLHHLFESIDSLTATQPTDLVEGSDTGKEGSKRLKGTLHHMLEAQDIVDSIYNMDIADLTEPGHEYPLLDAFIVDEINMESFEIHPDTENLTEDRDEDKEDIQRNGSEHGCHGEFFYEGDAIDLSPDAWTTSKTPDRGGKHSGHRQSIIDGTVEAMIGVNEQPEDTNFGQPVASTSLINATVAESEQIDCEDSEEPIKLPKDVGRIVASRFGKLMIGFVCSLTCFGWHYASIYGSNLSGFPEYTEIGFQVLLSFRECTSQYTHIDTDSIKTCGGVFLASGKDFFLNRSSKSPERVECPANCDHCQIDDEFPSEKDFLLEGSSCTAKEVSLRDTTGTESSKLIFKSHFDKLVMNTMVLWAETKDEADDRFDMAVSFFTSQWLSPYEYDDNDP
ncbi:serine/threonine protein kinase [Nitzschia inconspicua]|uniref:Serine/threonine protein kinase n=1 Tax=Nitzschia inconspicua TaxID=303405 RepID=A0A9K3LHC7_9STRA|nr:serine/threonine protein kinase [Nitzschia inconspicua]KAG7361905.1 serine/threonine protein kinase [Nitzschia inconspicua]